MMMMMMIFAGFLRQPPCPYCGFWTTTRCSADIGCRPGWVLIVQGADWEEYWLYRVSPRVSTDCTGCRPGWVLIVRGAGRGEYWLYRVPAGVSTDCTGSRPGVSTNLQGASLGWVLVIQGAGWGDYWLYRVPDGRSYILGNSSWLLRFWWIAAIQLIERYSFLTLNDHSKCQLLDGPLE